MSKLAFENGPLQNMPFGDGCQQTAAERRRLVTVTCMQKTPFENGVLAASGSKQVVLALAKSYFV
jgi:hypothetical protein